MQRKGEFWEWIRSIVVAVILAVLIRIFIIEIFLVEGNSMYPTLKDNERLVVNKFIYRLQE
ncbi:MAG: S26 family signal peptidase, partial [Firmicutes bacterium]|nr:S26 family signal peptidase [Bacillota bacterium]